MLIAQRGPCFLPPMRSMRQASIDMGVRSCCFSPGMADVTHVLASFPLDPSWSECSCDRATHSRSDTTSQIRDFSRGFAQAVVERLSGIRPELTDIAARQQQQPQHTSARLSQGELDDEEPEHRAGQPVVEARFAESFPTVERKRHKELEKARKQQGKVAPKKSQQVEQVFEDCGSDFSPIYLDTPFDSEISELEVDGTLATDVFLEAFDMLDWDRGFVGSEVTLNLDGDLSVTHFADINALCHSSPPNRDEASDPGFYLEVAEICGGAGMTG